MMSKNFMCTPSSSSSKYLSLKNLILPTMFMFESNSNRVSNRNRIEFWIELCFVYWEKQRGCEIAYRITMKKWKKNWLWCFWGIGEKNLKISSENAALL